MFLRFSLRSVGKRIGLYLYTIAGGNRFAHTVSSMQEFKGVTGSTSMLQTFKDCVFSRQQSASRGVSTKDPGKVQQIYQNENPMFEEEYEEAIKTLNTLQSNADSIRRSIALNNKQTPLDDMYMFLKRAGLSLAELDKLSIIHVSGTKGKGSTCALTESILRAHDVRTGFFSSPHLVSVRERIRLNGEPISKQKFISVFWRIYKRLHQARTHDADMPSYFRFLTIMCFQVFLEEKVDVVILEVGIGGELDCTNVVRNTETIGITSLGLEHTQLLGNTLEEIAWQKAGIIKPHAHVYTAVSQPVCLDIIKKRALEKNATVHVVPNFHEYLNDNKTEFILKNLNKIIELNGSLAIQLAYDWLRHHRNDFQFNDALNYTQLTEQVLDGLVHCNWPGRCQVVNLKKFSIHLDGAHTAESMCVCSDWFGHVAGDNKIPKVLIFNTTGDRDSKKLLDILRRKSHFELICFVPNIASDIADNKDNMSVFSIRDQLKRAKMHAGNWHLLCAEDSEPDNSHVFGSIKESFNFIAEYYSNKQAVDVLVTGSLHLIGATVLALKQFKMSLEHM